MVDMLRGGGVARAGAGVRISIISCMLTAWYVFGVRPWKDTKFVGMIQTGKKE